MRKAVLNIERGGHGRGASVVEVLLAIALFAIIVTGLTSAFVYTYKSVTHASNRERALLLAQEGLEATRNIRDSGYQNLSDGTRGIAIQNNQWFFSGSQDTTEGFTRSLQIASVDTKRKDATSTVTWEQGFGRTASVSLATRLTNWLAVRHGTPTLYGTLDLTVANSGHDSADAVSIATQGNYVYLGRNTNPSSEFFVIDVSNPASPTISGQLALGGTPADIAVSGNYAYIASNDNAAELTVIDISNPTSPSIAATVNLPGNTDALSVVMGKPGYVYLTRKASGEKEFYVFDISTPTSPSLIGSLDLLGDSNEMAASGNYAYLASTENTQEFQVIDVTTATAPSLLSSLNLDEGDAASDGISIAIDINTVYLGRNGSSGAPEFYVINVATPASPSITSTLDIGTHILQSIDYSSVLQFTFFANTNPASDDDNAVDVNNPASPTLLTSLNLDGTPYKLVYSSSLDKVFVASGSDTQELQIIAP